MALEKQKDSVMTSRDGVVKETVIRTKRNVKYVFDTRASDAVELQIPYAVVVDGEVQAKYRDKPEKLGKRREIDIPVDPGSTVGLYLNSDVHPDHRKHLAYVVKAGDNDVLVNVVEKIGKEGDPSAEVGKAELKPAKSGGKMVDVYAAELNGNVWMRISHVYTPEQADALIPSHTAPAIREALRRIYSGQAGATLVVQFPKSDGLANDKLTVHFMEEMKKNVSESTRSYKFPDDMITRAHPKAFAALFTEARAVGVNTVHVNSAWRPSYGSIKHRAGLGLDIKYIEDAHEKTPINRAWLTHANVARNSNVSDDEKKLFSVYRKAQADDAENIQHIEKLKKMFSTERSPEKQALIQEQIGTAERKAEQDLVAIDRARMDWDHERDAHEPQLVKSLRSNLAKNPSIKQLLDPWYMDIDTQDKTPGTRNEQKRGLEDAHSNHLHISILEQKISP